MTVKLPYAYTSREFDFEREQYFYRVRHYIPALGQFLTVDPIHFKGGDTNLYRYVENNPIKFTDPDGLYTMVSAEGGTGGDFTIGDILGMVGGAYDFGKNYIELRLANTHGADAYHHCMANCQAASRGYGGQLTAEAISDLREWLDYNVKKDSADSCAKDQASNLKGRNGAYMNCSNVCGPFPNGYPERYK